MLIERGTKMELYFVNKKKEIIDRVKKNAVDNYTRKLINKYLEKYPGDTEIITILAYIYLVDDNVDKGYNLLKFVLVKCPYSIDALFLLGQVYNEKNDFYNSLISLEKGHIIYLFFKEKNINNNNYLFFNDELCKKIIKDINNNILSAFIGCSREEKNEIKEKLISIKKQVNKNLYLFDDIVRTKDSIIGENFFNSVDDKRFCGVYDPFISCLYSDMYDRNLQLFKVEMLKELKTGSDIRIKLVSNSLLPILTKEEQTTINIRQKNDDIVSIPINFIMHFNYFKIDKGNIEIHSSKELIVAEPVSLIHYKNNKRLVISLFIDGISQKVISKYGLKNIMPNTYHFFKEGMICNNAFSASDWTCPSIASLISGLNVPNHMMIHPDINIKYPKEQKLLFEYFKEVGYYTAIISGDWRSTSATYDSIRGVDRYIAKHQNCGFRTEDVITNVIDHLETFKETDQYIWVGTGDLHDIADEVSLPTAVQVKMDLEEFDTGKKSKTSVKQQYSPNKIAMYVKVAAHIDSKLKILYDYIEENYDEDEFVVTLFGDHGQAYIVKPDEFHLSRGMTNIGFMTRGGGVSGVSDEYINLVDYTNIITKLAGMENLHIDSDGKLPKTFGGEKENDFAISETIHPGDPYMIAMHSSKYTFYMETHAVVTDYGKVDMSEYDTKLYDFSGNEIFDEEIINKFIQYVLDRTKYIQIY